MKLETATAIYQCLLKIENALKIITAEVINLPNVTPHTGRHFLAEIQSVLNANETLRQQLKKEFPK